MKARRISTFIGTREERAAVHAQRAAAQRQAALSRMPPDQRAKVLQNEQAREDKKATDAQAAAAKEKRKQDDKTRRTVGKVGSKAEREEFRANKQRVRREDMLSRMTPEQREKALKQETAAQEAQAAEAKREADDKTRRTVGMVGSKEEREAFQNDKQAVQREDMLKGMNPQEREAALAQETAAHQAEAAQAAAQDLREQRAEQAKAARTVAVVGNQERRDAFGTPRPARGTPTTVTFPAVQLSAARLSHELALLNTITLSS